MNKKLLIGIIVIIVVGVGLVIAGAIIKPAFITLGLVVALIGVWIYLGYMVQKKKANLFDVQVEPRIAERLIKMLKIFLLVAGISLVVGIVGAILYNVLYGIKEIEEPVSFFVGVLGLFGFVIATIGGLVIFLKGRRKTA
jgi:cytochrome c biogenesis factor